jgi:Zn-dependent M28 family amino/carboxypeptidase
MIRTNNIFIFLLSIFLIVACQEKKRTVVQVEDNTPVITVKAPAFNADSAYTFVTKQVSFGPRVPNTQAHRQAGEYLVNTLKRYGAEVTVQDFVAEAYTGAKLQSRNIIAAFYPQERKRILLAAHWDSRHMADKDSINSTQPILGANDGASGVGVLLEIARILQQDSAGPSVGEI